jgi:AcrR family transcriptional regulator
MTVTDARSTLFQVGRWEPDTADRLRRAALELFVEQGYEATTIDDIVAAVGVTQRTFFRHFADKEEVLFDEDASMQMILVDAAGAYLREHGTCSDVGLEAARAATAALARSFEKERVKHRARWQVLSHVPSLQGRQLVKQERWGTELRTVLVDNGIPPPDAAVAVEVASAALRLAYAEWLTGARAKRLLPLLTASNTRFDAVLRSAEPDPPRTGRVLRAAR